MNSPLHLYKAEFFKALGHPLRLAILDSLRDGPLSVTKLQEMVQVDQSILSQHLAKLRSFKFVTARREKTTIFYHVHDTDVYIFLDLAKNIYGRQLQLSQDILNQLNTTEHI
ncbi:ArsR/SmtB family transcription factor [Dyadobacter frigoris]|uniref:Winged helix-turn-helix transcriptional regulator n=1 Tax=Dyadobacter frigoris TaxID=2576211 RepID=A0A4U6D554_9BACT|nr:metalloregulator ArsR/SmtB family transcription factor [Dyadobacter frigoris]TKT92470.1 winged helix-turn-helix transcriptional regulator [Dyadobacter frigoris]GLU55260.1 transcriptional regulator [Dyadobacter frigoris]